MRTTLRAPLLAALGLALAALGGCSEGAEVDAGTGLPEGVSPSMAVRDLLTAVRPLPADAGPRERNDWHARRKAILERLRAAGPAIGEEAWRLYRADEDRRVEERIGLLDVAAHNLPDETREHLVELVAEFGPDLYLRRAACELLAEKSPEAAVATLEPILLRRLRDRTYPPEDKMLSALLRAKRALGQDATDLLTAVATDLTQYEEARHLAIRELSGTPSLKGQVALRQLLVESGTNHYLRRLAAQSLHQSVPADELCPLLEEVLVKESDQNFQAFLLSLIEKHCR